MKTDAIQKLSEGAGVAVGGTATAAVWLSNIDVMLRIAVSLATLAVLVFAIEHQIRRRWPRDPK